MLKITLKNLWGRKLRLVTTGFAVFIGVAFMAGTLVLTETVQATFDDLFADVNAGVDVEVRRSGTVDAGGVGLRGRVDDAVTATVAAVDGVAVAIPIVQGYTQIVGADGEAIGDPGRGAPTFGMTWVDDPDLNPFTIAEGRAPLADNEIVIDRGSAKTGNLHVGDTIRLLAGKPVPDMTLVGIATFGRADSPLGASAALYTPAAAQSYVGEPGQSDVIVVRADDGLDQEALRSAITAALPEGYEARTSDEVTDENQTDMAETLSFFSTFLITFALVALFVGAFIIYNTFSILVAQRMRETALLRAVGASRRQIVLSVVVESIVVGAIAAVLGLVAGLGVASLLKGLLAAVGFDIPAGALVLSARTVLTSLVVGVAVTVAAALLPARRAAQAAPVEALTGAALESEDHLGRRLVAGGAMTAVGLAIGAAALIVELAQPAAAIGLGGVLMFLGVAVLSPVVARPVMSWLGRPLTTARGVAGTLARENAMRNPRRTSATAAALMIGVALVGFITIFASSAKASIRDAVGEQFAGDFVVRSGTFGFGGLEPSVAARVAALPEVGAASGFRFAPMELDGDAVGVAAVDPVPYADVLDLEVQAGTIDALGLDGLAIDDDIAAAKGWHVGDVLPATFAKTGATQLQVRAIFAVEQIGPDLMISNAAHDLYFTEHFDSDIYVKTADGVSADTARRAIEAVLVDQPTAELLDREGFIDNQIADIDQMLSLIYALLALAILIAALGIANTLALSIHERTHELGLLRAVGMTRSQLRTSVRWESVMIALFGTTLGLAIAIALGTAMVTGLADKGFGTLVLPGGQLVVIVLLAAACGVVAAIRPARRAAQLNVLDAIATT